MSKTLTNAEAACKYSEEAGKLAKAIGDIKDICNCLEYLSERTGDNGDPRWELEDALKDLGIALASTVEYANEYASEDPKCTATDPED